MVKEPKLYDCQIIPNGDGVVIQRWYGPTIKWSAVQWFRNEEEAKKWLKGGVPSSPDPKRKPLTR